MKISMSQVKVFFSALAATIVAIAGAQEAHVLDLIPVNVMHKLTEIAVLIGLLGASPIGRLFFKDAPSNDIIPKAERLPPGKPSTDTDITKPD